MLISVMFEYAVAYFAGKEISEEEGGVLLIPPSISVVGRFGQLSLNMQAQTVCSDEAELF